MAPNSIDQDREELRRVARRQYGENIVMHPSVEDRALAIFRQWKIENGLICESSR